MDALEDVLADYQSTRLQWKLAAISMTILAYEYFLTFPYEVERFWPRRLKNSFYFFNERDEYDGTGFHRTRSCSFNWSSFLFFSNRYIALFGHFPVMVELFWRTRGGDLDDVKVNSSLPPKLPPLI
ncbi:hypothetical protein Agabi119p4_9900 [Agaricus bisporus var. burnettii]|uniref:DUF6533 domain-containing protein n=1 Tax=Agaricus bisporus var. burnettii TaxID=192524 RepID=A0A8H7C499_AGABI|nr:hypothetical protein Agabi119p4_9900 [Agaricus bisporus var. burnettii]